MTHSETYKGCTIQGETKDGEEIVTWTDTFGITWPARFWAHAKREIDKFDRMVERKWMEGRESHERRHVRAQGLHVPCEGSR